MRTWSGERRERDEGVSVTVPSNVIDVVLLAGYRSVIIDQTSDGVNEIKSLLQKA